MSTIFNTGRLTTTAMALVVLSATACCAEEQCSLRCQLTTSSPGWFTAIKTVMRPSVATRMGTKASIEISSGPSLSRMSIRGSQPGIKSGAVEDPRNRRYFVSMLPTVDSPGRIRLAIVLECIEPGQLSREIKTSTLLEEGKPWECTLNDQQSGFSLDCQIQGYWTLPPGADSIRFAPDGEPIYVPKKSGPVREDQ